MATIRTNRACSIVALIVSTIATLRCDTAVLHVSPTFSRPVKARMRRSTERHASVPLLTKRTISTHGTRSITAFAISFCD